MPSLTWMARPARRLRVVADTVCVRNEGRGRAAATSANPAGPGALARVPAACQRYYGTERSNCRPLHAVPNLVFLVKGAQSVRKHAIQRAHSRLCRLHSARGSRNAYVRGRGALCTQIVLG